MSSITSGRVGVIGAGLGGLAAACTLAARGHSVIVFEKNDWPGGKAAVLEQDGFRFDMGPTILTMPSVLSRIFSEAGRTLEDYVKLIRIDPQWRSFFADGTTLDLKADTAQMASSVEEFAPGSGAGYSKFMEQAARLHRVSDRFFFWRPIGGLRDMFEMKAAMQPSMLSDLMAMNPGRSVAATVRGHVPDKRVAQMLDHFTQYVGSAPDLSPAVLCGIAHMQTDEGVWYPVGGTGAIPKALARLAGELGVEIRYGTGIKRISVGADGGVSGVETDRGESIPLVAVVSNADAVRTNRELLGGKPGRRFERRRSYEPACSGVVLYLGLEHRYEHLLHHNFVFSEDPEAEFEAIYRKGEPAQDPTCYVCAPGRTDDSVAPPGGEALYVLVHTPYLRKHHDWAKMLPAYRETILNKLAATSGLHDLSKQIRTERWLTPLDIHNRYGVLNGAIYGIASHGRWLGAFKPSNRSPDVKRLYLAGGAAHPGPGMPMVLMSGWIAADALDRDGVVRTQSQKNMRDGSIPPLLMEPKSIPSAQAREVCVPAVITRYSPKLTHWFTRHIKRFFLARNFHSVRLSRTSAHHEVPEGPMIVALNHPSWWDPLMGFLLAEQFPKLTHFTPMEAAALARYRIFERLGVFGIDPHTMAGARDFLRTSQAILSQADRALWVTVQGHFTDVRQRPVGVQAGVAHLAHRLKKGFVLPLALEYVFWEERYPEALARFGHPIPIDAGKPLSAEQWQVAIEESLASTQDVLSAETQRRDPAHFELLVGGKAGVGGVYDWWRAFRAWRTGDRFRASHGSEQVMGLTGDR